jgi:hypothetical protein
MHASPTFLLCICQAVYLRERSKQIKQIGRYCWRHNVHQLTSEPYSTHWRYHKTIKSMWHWCWLLLHIQFETGQFKQTCSSEMLATASMPLGFVVYVGGRHNGTHMLSVWSPQHRICISCKGNTGASMRYRISCVSKIALGSDWQKDSNLRRPMV